MQIPQGVFQALDVPNLNLFLEVMQNTEGKRSPLVLHVF